MSHPLTRGAASVFNRLLAPALNVSRTVEATEEARMAARAVVMVAATEEVTARWRHRR
jgi:hypothetical protein